LLDAPWLDSTAVAALIAREELTEEMSADHSLYLSLSASREGDLFWNVTRMWSDRETRVRLQHGFWLEATRGDFVYERVVRYAPDGKRTERRRSRMEKADWESGG